MSDEPTTVPVSTGDAMDAANAALQLELNQQASSIVSEVQSLLAGKSGLEGKVAFYYVAKKYFTDRKTGQPYNPKDWILDVLAYGSLINRLQLNPLTGDISVVHYWNNWTKRHDVTFITTIQAMRKIAHRTGHFAGADQPIITDDVNGEPLKAEAAVYVLNEKTGERMKVEGVAYWSEFAKYEYDKKTKKKQLATFWKKMPRHMLGKCALAQAYRNAFSEEFASLYTAEELDTPEPAVVELPVAEDPKSEEKKKELATKFEQQGEVSKPPEQKQNVPFSQMIECSNCADPIEGMDGYTGMRPDGTKFHLCGKCNAGEQGKELRDKLSTVKS